MPPLTTGYNTTEQATEILNQLRTDMAAVGISTITRARIWRVPDRPFVALLDPHILTEPLGLGQEEARWTWTLLIARDIEGGDRRSDELDTLADLAMRSLTDILYTSDKFTVQGGDGPERLAGQHLVEIIERMGENIDAAAIQFTTRHIITPPC